MNQNYPVMYIAQIAAAVFVLVDDVPLTAIAIGLRLTLK